MRWKINSFNILFKKKNNLIFFIIGLIVSFFASFALISIPLKTEKEYADYSDFPINYCVYFENSDSVSENFSGLKSKKYKICKDIDISQTNIKLKGNNTITLIGVEYGFENYPVLYMDEYNVFPEKCDIDSGNAFTEDDFVLHSGKAIMNSYYINKMGICDCKIKINNKTLFLVGSLTTTNYIIRHKNDVSNDIPIYVPMSTFEDIVGDAATYNVSLYDTKGYSFSEYNELETFFSKEKNDIAFEKEIEKKFDSAIIIIISFFSLAIITSSIIQYILLKNKHYEIGIKRAIGASQSTIIFEYFFDYSVVSFLGVFIGTLFGISCGLVLNMPYAIIFRYALIITNYKTIILSVASYYFIGCLFEIISLYIGTKINILTIITEER